uniref:Tetratricopeptide repeat protein n=1 Tax=Caldimicrobium thiodismutans TaxID=1653476 RepID=A0A832LW53_9BACT
MGKTKLMYIMISFLLFINININFCEAKEKIVFLAGGNAWQLFEAYTNREKVKLGDLKVKIWDGKDFKEYKINWTDYLSGEGVKNIWKRKLSKVEAKYDPRAIEMAKQYGWDIFVVEPIRPAKKEETKEKESKESATRPEGQACNSEAKSHINLGLQFVQNRQIDNAIKEFNQAIKISPNCALAYANLVSAYCLKKNYNLAIDTYREGLNKAGNDGFLHVTGAIAFTLKGDFDYALQALEKALQANYRDKKTFEAPDFKPLFKTRKNEVCTLLGKFGVIIKECL